MKVAKDNIYHIYNQGNNRQPIFFGREDYLLFLKEYRRLVAPFADTMCYCLMPNHFHFMIYANERSMIEKKLGSIYIQQLSDGFRRLLSTYAHEINKKNNSIGSLFRQKTRAKLIEGGNPNSTLTYAELCFFYIHQNPVSANLVEKNTDWEFSSARDYYGSREGTICNQNLTLNLLGWEGDDLSFVNQQYIITKEVHQHFFEPQKVKKSDQGQTE